MANDIFPGASLVQLLEWGYPMGSLRPTPPTSLAFSVIHITANLALAQNEAAWRLNDPGLQNSATFFVNRDGSVVQCLGDPLHMDPWTNGDVANPDTSNPRIAALGGVNPNERSLVTIENIGREPEAPITPAQEATNGRIIAYYHAKAGLPINRQTVIGHYQINSVNRANCPSTNKSVLDRIVALAAGGTAAAGGDMTPIPAGSFTHVTKKTSLVSAAPFRATPSASAAVHQTYPVGTAFPVDVIVSAEGSDWYGGWLYVNAGGFIFGYFGTGVLNPLADAAPAAGITQKQYDDAVAKAAMDAKVAAAKAGAEAAAAAAVSYAKSLPSP